MRKTMLSILIPNYGYSSYIFDCLDSIVNQKNNALFGYEVIMCDQSDPTTFEKIKAEVTKKYRNRVKLIHSDIKGLFRARHTLLSHANGDYIAFVDSDDCLADNSLDQICKLIHDTNSKDLYFFGFNRIDSNGKFLGKSDKMPVLHKNYFYQYILSTDLYNRVWTKVFKKELASGSSFPFDNITYGEDKCFSMPICKKARSICFYDNIYPYNYRINEDSITHSISFELAEERMFKVNDFVLMSGEIIKNEFLKNYLDNLTSFVHFLKNNKRECKNFLDKCRTYAIKNGFIYSTKIGFKNTIKKYLLLFRSFALLMYLS